MEKFNTIGQLYDYTEKENLEVYGRNDNKVYVKTYWEKTNKHTVEVLFDNIWYSYDK